MPTASANGVDIYYEEDGQGPAVLLLHGLLFSTRAWEHQAAALAGRYRTIAVDLRGHGRSASPPGPYTLDEMADDVSALMRHLGVERADLVGHSMGGMIAMRLALARPETVRSLSLLNTSAEPEDAQRLPGYEAMAAIARQGNLEAVIDPIMDILFAPGYREARPAEAARWRRNLLEQDTEGLFQAAMAVFRRGDISQAVASIKAPTLVVSAQHDMYLPNCELIHGLIAGSRLAVIPEVGHMAPIEAPEAVTEHILDFLGRVP